MMIGQKIEPHAAVTRYILDTFPSTFHNHPADEGTLIGLPKPYTVQGADGGFPEMYYWDSYFTNLGLLQTPYREMARNNTDNLLFLLDRFGYVPNASRTWGTDRSQPPYLSMMVRDVFESYGDREWLRDAVALLQREYDFWMELHGTPIGLSRHVYVHPEYRERLLAFYAYIARDRLKLNARTEEEKIAVACRYMAEAETGWDFNPRFDGRCPDFLPVDLNSNLHVYEMNFAHFARILNTGEAAKWDEAAEKRRQLMRRYLWDESRQTYADFDYVHQRHSPVVSAAMMHALMAKVADEKEASLVVGQLTRVERDFGIAACEAGQRSQTFQWDYPNGWPPSQYASVVGLLNYGYQKEARRVLEKYLGVIERNFLTSGRLWEKYNVETGTLEVADEYKMPSFLGWTAGLYLWGRATLQTFQR